MQFQHMSLNRKLLAALAFVAIVLFIWHELELYLPDLEGWINGMGVFAPLGFILFFVVLAPIFVSIDALCFAAGVLFPIMTGELTIIIATYLSAAIIFYLGRDLFRASVLTIIAGHQRLANLDKVISGENAFKLMFLLRLTPLPFAMLSYALSVTEVKFWPYFSGDQRYLGLQRHTGLFGLYRQTSDWISQRCSADGLCFTLNAGLWLIYFIRGIDLCGKNCGRYVKTTGIGKQPRRVNIVGRRIAFNLIKSTLSLSSGLPILQTSTNIN
ncbi:TVP38/TMEM64 family protein [Methyloglobulus sp.]|uniref:TVP38/TMEM64 family protein n=1 Tax=Methyloglobulus sp. TaxID=2518622 RepID=UPI0039890A5C